MSFPISKFLHFDLESSVKKISQAHTYGLFLLRREPKYQANELKNRRLHVRWQGEKRQNDVSEGLKRQNDVSERIPGDLPIKERAVVELIMGVDKNPPVVGDALSRRSAKKFAE